MGRKKIQKPVSPWLSYPWARRAKYLMSNRKKKHGCSNRFKGVNVCNCVFLDTLILCEWVKNKWLHTNKNQPGTHSSLMFPGLVNEDNLLLAFKFPSRFWYLEQVSDVGGRNSELPLLWTVLLFEYTPERDTVNISKDYSAENVLTMNHHF